MAPTPAASMAPTPAASMAPTPAASMAPTPAVSMAPAPASKSKNNKTALIASLLSAAAAIVIAGVVFATCYFKKHLCFSQFNPDASEQCNV